MTSPQQQQQPLHLEEPATIHSMPNNNKKSTLQDEEEDEDVLCHTASTMDSREDEDEEEALYTLGASTRLLGVKELQHPPPSSAASLDNDYDSKSNDEEGEEELEEEVFSYHLTIDADGDFKEDDQEEKEEPLPEEEFDNHHHPDIDPREEEELYNLSATALPKEETEQEQQEDLFNPCTHYYPTTATTTEQQQQDFDRILHAGFVYISWDYFEHALHNHKNTFRHKDHKRQQRLFQVRQVMEREYPHCVRPFDAAGTKIIFISHTWKSMEHPDPEGRLWAQLKLQAPVLQDQFDGFFFDYSCLYQSPRTKEQEHAFQQQMGLLPSFVLYTWQNHADETLEKKQKKQLARQHRESQRLKRDEQLGQSTLSIQYYKHLVDLERDEPVSLS